VRVHPSPDAYAAWLERFARRGLPAAAGAGLDEAITQVRAEVEHQLVRAGVKGGRMSGIHPRKKVLRVLADPVSPLQRVVRLTNPGHLLEEPVGPHFVRPNPGRAADARRRGTHAPVRNVVHHPGVVRPPRPFAKAVRAVRRDGVVAAAVQRSVADALEES
jgi:hypothetical protein